MENHIENSQRVCDAPSVTHSIRAQIDAIPFFLSIFDWINVCGRWMDGNEPNAKGKYFQFAFSRVLYQFVLLVFFFFHNVTAVRARWLVIGE